LKLHPLPDEVRQVIINHYASPIKTDANQVRHDLRATSPSLGEAMILAKIVITFRPAATLEVGFGLGGSTVGIAAARKYLALEGQHLILDPYQKTLSGSVGLMEIANAGLTSFVNWLPEKSEDYLNAASSRGEGFDFIFVDGAHGTGQVVTDAFYCDRVLNPGGIIAFHDGLLFSTMAAIRYLVKECKYRFVNLPVDSTAKTTLRMLRHTSVLGMWYATHLVPKMHRSLVAVRKED
jgi:predicted O-methyltransferase YrrM